MLPTPSTSHVDTSRVYDPAEDSYLLLDVLSSVHETQYLRRQFGDGSPSPLVCEVGTGSGVVIAFLTAHAPHIFGRSDIFSIATDINPFACRAAHETVAQAVLEQHKCANTGTFLGAVNGDLVSAVKPGAVDMLVFNPPYVPSDYLPGATDDVGASAFARDSRLLALATDGGHDGMEVTDRLLAELPAVLSKRGVAYVLLCARNKPAEVAKTVRGWDSWDAQVIGDSGKKGGFEKLCVLRIARSSSANV